MKKAACSAIPQYMDLLATTFYFPVPFYATVGGSDIELRAFLTAKLRNWLTNLTIEALEVRSLSTDHHSEFYLQGIEYNSMKTSNLPRLNKAGLCITQSFLMGVQKSFMIYLRT